MLYLDKRIANISAELLELSVVKRIKLGAIEYKKGFFLTPQEADSDSSPYTLFSSDTMSWRGTDEHFWFRCEFTMPQEYNGKEVWVQLGTAIGGWDSTNNPQFLVFVNGNATQGSDINHQDIQLCLSAKAGEKFRLDFQAYTGINDSEAKFYCFIEERSPEITALYYDLLTPLEAFISLNADDKPRREIERVLNDTINLLDLREPYSDEFYASVTTAREYLQKALYTDLAGYDDVIATCIGHTHIDVAWKWTVEQTKEKTARSFSTVLKLMEEYPEYLFMSSQPQLYVFLKERYPELYEIVKKRVAERRWEPEGGMWVEADCNVTSGESLVRQFIYGKRFFKEEFGVDNRILWLPDVFGYSGALPQIMKKCGIDYFMTTKLSWNQINPVPMDTLYWRGIDGTEVLTHFITTKHESKNETSEGRQTFFTTYNGEIRSDVMVNSWERYHDKLINNDILIAFGHGDGGGGATRGMLERAKRMEKGIIGIPKIQQGFSAEYFERLEKTVSDNPSLRYWEGEFYFEYHRGTYTSMARNKRSNREAESHIMDLELLSVLADDIAYPQDEIDSIWRTVLLNQFHDILPGSSIHEVYEVTKREYTDIEARLGRLIDERMSALSATGDAVTVFNTTGFAGGDIVSLTTDATALKDSDGTVYPVQQTATGAVVYIDNLPSKGYKTLTPVYESIDSKSPFTLIDDRSIETPYYIAVFDENGNITSLLDKENNREVVQPDTKANQLRIFEDKPMRYDSWDIEMYYTEKSWDVTSPVAFEWVSIGAVVATLKVVYSVSKSTITQYVHFYAYNRRIDFETEVDWQLRQHLLKVFFPVDIHTDEASFDIQFGNLTRKIHKNTSWDIARFESCGHKWMDLSEGRYGVSLLNNCKYGYSAENSCIALTLIKSGIFPNPTADEGMHSFTYSLLPHAGRREDAETVTQAYKLNQPARVAYGGKANSCFELAKVSHTNAVLETIKRAEDGRGYIVRIYECDNARTNATLTWGREFAVVEECNLIEETISPVSKNADGTISFTIKPYEVKTFRII